MSGRLVVISGPSGVGKGTIREAVLERTGAEFSVSATTRSPRPGEKNGRDYRFVGRDEFVRMRDRGELLEWAEVFGELYGTPEAPVRRAVADGRTVLLEIDVQGALQVHRKMPEATYVLIVPPSREELARRIGGRGTESDEDARRRLAKAEEEIAAARESGIYTHEVVNDDLDRAIEEVAGIVER
jgi:guanylate kinase